jgi:hypothetical protein
MKAGLSVLALLSFLCTALVVGCIPGLKSTKPDSTPANAAAAKGAPGPSASAKTPAVPNKELDSLLATPPPPDRAPAGLGNKRSVIQPSDLQDKDEVSRAALVLAQGIKDVKHVKSCYSKASGGWFLLLYVQRGKKTSEQEYSWNKETKEWEIYAHRKDLPTEQLDIYLKSELPDEKCFLLR